MSEITIFFIIIMCLGFHIFLSACEMSMVSCNKLKIKHESKKGHFRALLAERFLSKPKKFLGTIIVGINIMVVTSSSLTSNLLGRYFSSEVTTILSTFILLPVILLFAEYIPKTIVRKNATQSCLILAPFLQLFSTILYPFSIAIISFSELITNIIKKKDDKRRSFFSRDELKILIKEFGRFGTLQNREKMMISEIFDFVDIRAEETMIPLKNVVVLPAESSVAEAKKTILDTGHSRIPVFSGSKKNIIGTIHAIKLLDIDNSLTLKKVIEKPYYIKRNKLILEVLEEVRRNRKFMAIVTNEEHNAVGVLTLEDIMEEIVGDIEDEYDVE